MVRELMQSLSLWPWWECSITECHCWA